MPICPNCGREFDNRGLTTNKCCSRACDQAWTLKKVSTAAAVGSAAMLAQQTAMLEQQQARQQAAEAQARAAALADIAEKKAIADEAAKKCGFSGAEEALYWQEKAGPGADFKAAIEAKRFHEEYEREQEKIEKERRERKERSRQNSINALEDEGKIQYSKAKKVFGKMARSQHNDDKLLWDGISILIGTIAIIILRRWIPFLYNYRGIKLFYLSLGICLILNYLIKKIRFLVFVNKIKTITSGGSIKVLEILKKEYENSLYYLCEYTMVGIAGGYYGIGFIVVSFIASILNSTVFSVISFIGFLIIGVLIFISLGSHKHLDRRQRFLNTRIYYKLGFPKPEPVTKSVNEKNTKTSDYGDPLAIKKFHDEIAKYDGNFTYRFGPTGILIRGLVTYKECHEYIEFTLGKDYEDKGWYAKKCLSKIEKAYGYLDEDTKKIFLDIQAKYKNKAEKTMEKYENLPITKKNKEKCCNIIDAFVYNYGNKISRLLSKRYVEAYVLD